MAATWQILLYYLYTRLDDPEAYLEEQVSLCERLGLRGRILIAGEGINGTVSGETGATREYMRAMRSDKRTAAMEFKIDPAGGHVFPQLSVKLRQELVTLGLGPDDVSPRELTGRRLRPREWREMMDRKDVVLLDARNEYEWALGRFEGAILPEVGSFRDLPEWVERNRERLQGKKILTYCTGGIRCEKFSGFLLRQGFPEVFQLDGGIVTYGHDPETRGEKFDGKCYVFDQRVGVEVDRRGTSRVVSRCSHCRERCDRYVNCAWRGCNRQHFCCKSCEEDSRRYCGRVCEEAAVVSLAADANEGF